MPDHIFSLSVKAPYIHAVCSCGGWVGESMILTLDELNQFAHEHIEAAEGSEQERWRAAAYDYLSRSAQLAPAAYVHGLDQPEDDPRRGVMGDG